MIVETRFLKPVAVATAAKDPPFVKEFFQNRPGLWVSDSFHERFDLDAPDHSVPGRPYVAFLLKEEASDRDICQELPESHLSTLAEIAGFIEAQPNGKEGLLLNNGYVNIFYVLDKNGQVFAVGVYWFSDVREWDISVYTLDEDGEWGVESRVLCPGNAAL